MLRPTAVKVKAVPDYRLIVVFDNGEEKIFDVKPYIHGEWYSELKNIDYFKTVNVDGFTVVWKNGQDICPDDLYYSSIPADFALSNVAETEISSGRNRGY